MDVTIWDELARTLIDNAPVVVVLFLMLRWFIAQFERQLVRQEQLCVTCQAALAEILEFIRRRHPE